ncbi:hypothetical protein [Micromonospora sp. AP08]|uniref:hypothetical protein n=1 Tax=Micromonospora sp. AP08 TaxID=2604467 RepID=UPI0016520679|nr:hypothetical protein [Micromonospora sp. AP08]
MRRILDHGTALRVQARDLLARAGALSAPPPGTPASREDLRAGLRTLLRAFTGA